jgi:DNA-binding SARP family transcriptional activator
MGALTLTTLGAPQVHHAGVACSFPIRKVLALALYLAVTAQPHTRAHLAALLWPEADEAHGSLSLRQTFLRLRQALGSDAETHLQLTGDLVRLELGADGMVDVTGLAVATAPQTPPDQRQVALQTYQGAFLAHLTIDDAPDFMDWVYAQRALGRLFRSPRRATHAVARRRRTGGRGERARRTLGTPATRM